MKKIHLSVLVFIIHFTLSGQSTYIGLKEESSVLLSQSDNYWPKFQLLDSTLYAPTFNGIYSKHLSSLSDTLWNLYAFEGVPIRDFIKKDNELIAITANINDSLLVYSNDNGLTYTYLNDDHFNDPELVPIESNTMVYQIAHNSPGFDTVLVSHHYGISLSTDMGNTWSLLSEYVPEYQYRFVNFHPSNSQKLYTAGEDGFFSSYVYASSDGGNSWSTIHSVFNDCVHLVAFHPSNEETYLIGREGRISKSTDSGATWSTFDLTPYLYVYEIKYDAIDPNILYASGGLNGELDTIYFIKSIDAGDTWSFVHEEIPGNGNVAQVLEFKVLDDRIIYRTALGGLYQIDSSILTTTSDIQSEQSQFELFPNPVYRTATIRSDQIIENLILYNNLGQEIFNDQVDANTYALNLENYKSGIYFLQVMVKGMPQIMRIVKE